MNTILYFFSLAIIFTSLLLVRRFALKFSLPVVPCISIVGSSLLYLSCLIPGVFAYLTPIAVTITLLILSIGLSVFLIAAESRMNPNSLTNLPPEQAQLGDKLFLLFFFIGIIAAKPFADYVFDFPAMLLSRSYKLPWDAVSYHLPALVDFIQQRSLWSLNVPYQSYSFGYELIAGFPSFFFQDHWGFALANTFSIAFLLLSLFWVIRAILKPVAQSSATSLVLSCFLLSTGIWAWLFSASMRAVGKNDIFACASLLMAFGLLLEYATPRTAPLRPRLGLLALASLSLGLGIATKPTVLAYIPLFALIVWASVFHTGPSSLHNFASALGGFKKALCFVLGSLLVGGFWYVKNLIAYGKLYDPKLADTFGQSLIANLKNPDLYNPEGGYIILFFASCISCFLPLVMLRGTGKSGGRLHPLLLLLLFQLNSLVAFSVTPWAIFHFEKTWDLRLGMPFFTLSAISASLAIVCFCKSPYGQRKRLLAFGIVACAAIMSVVMPIWRNNRSVRGLPGYEDVKHFPKTNAYSWVQGLKKPVRIYAAGLRPYGLYGRNWQNRVFFDLHSSQLKDDLASRERIVAVIKLFRPDLIAISVDPHEGSGSEKPSIIDWLKSQRFFHEVYNDDTVSIFEIEGGWQEWLQERQSSPGPLLMGG